MAVRRGMALLAALSAVAMSALPVTGKADTPGTGPGLADRGRAIYEQGRGDDPILARVGAGGIAVPATNFACIGCHGVDGLGGWEGGVAPPDITWDRLAQPGEQGGRGYDAVAFARAVGDGVAPDGRALHPAMPRYTMTDADRAALIDYLKGLERAAPGVSGGEIRAATLLPTSGPLAQAGREVSIVLREVVRSINRRGGLHGRRLVLRQLGFDPAVPGDALAVVSRALRDDPPFCFLANVGVEANGAAVHALRANGVPDIAPLTQPLGGDEAWTVSLEPSVAEMARALIAFAATGLEGGSRRLAFLASDDRQGWAAADAGRAAARAYGIDLIEARGDAGGWSAVVARLKAAGVTTVLAFDRTVEVEAMLAEARAAKWAPVVFLAASATPSDPARALAFRRLVAGLGGLRDDLQRHAYAGALLLEEGVRRAGRRLSRDRLMEAIHGIETFDPGVVPPRSLRPGRAPDERAVAILRYEHRLRRYVPVTAPCPDDSAGGDGRCIGYRQSP